MLLLLALTLAAVAAPPATFAELVAHVGEHATSTTGCLLRPGTDGVDVVGRLQAGEAVLAPPPADWDTALRNGSGATIVTPIGRIGSASASIHLTSLVPVPRAMGQNLLPVLIVTDQATWLTVVAPPEMFMAPAAQELKPENLEHLRRDVVGKAAGVVVSAEAGVPMAQLVRAMDILSDFHGAVLLATVELDAKNVGRAPSLGYDLDAPGLCPQGISDVPKGQLPGQLTRTQQRDLPRAVQASAEAACAGALSPDKGGEMQLAFRVGSAGKVTDACVQHDTTNDPALQACVLKAVRATPFEPPSGGTFLNLSTKVALVPPGVAQRAICSE